MLVYVPVHVKLLKIGNPFIKHTTEGGKLPPQTTFLHVGDNKPRELILISDKLASTCSFSITAQSTSSFQVQY